MKPLPLSKVYQLIEPGPVVLLTTTHKGKSNIMTMSWHMMVEFEPPRIACVVSSGDFSYAALQKTKECVIALPAKKLAKKVVEIGNCSGATLDKFKKFKLTQQCAKRVKSPLISECFANLECIVVDTRLVRKYCIFILEVVEAWIDPLQKSPKTIHHRGYGTFSIDGRILKIKSKMR